MVRVTIGFWNIAGVRDKFENELVKDWLFYHDIIVFSEIKTRGTLSAPRFVAIKNSNSNHGVIVVLVKSHLYPKVNKIDVTTEGVVALEFSFMQGDRFIALYNEPTESLYFRPTTLASMPAHVNSG